MRIGKDTEAGNLPEAWAGRLHQVGDPFHSTYVRVCFLAASGTSDLNQPSRLKQHHLAWAVQVPGRRYTFQRDKVKFNRPSAVTRPTGVKLLHSYAVDSQPC